MSLINVGDFPIDPNTTDGTELAARLNRLKLAIYSGLTNATRPPDITPGGIWAKDMGGGAYLVMQYNGTADIQIGAGNVTSGTIALPFNTATAYKTGDFISDPATGTFLSAKYAIAAGSAFNAGDWNAGAIVTANFLKLAGGTLTGPLVLAANAVAALEAVPLQQLTSAIAAALVSITTPPQFDNDTSPATTAFVQRALGSFRGWAAPSVSTAMTAAYVGLWVAPTAAALTFTLPAASAAPPGSKIYIDGNGFGVTIARAGSDQIFIATGGGVTSLAVATFDTAEFMSNGSNGWYLTGGTTRGIYSTSGGNSKIVAYPAVAASGTAFTIATGIQPGAKIVHIPFSALSTNGATHYLVQFGTASGFETTGYVASVMTTASFTGSSAGFNFTSGVAAGDSWGGLMTIVLLDAATNLWGESGNCAGAADLRAFAGRKALSGPLTQIRIASTNGTDIYDSGVASATVIY